MPASFESSPHPAEPNLGAVIAGTLCLMSCYAQHPLALYADKIAANLVLLAANPELTGELRAVCRRLAERWDGIGAEAQRRARNDGPPPDLRALH